jgi:N,N'-diacetyllegionaminate synthase
MSTFVIAEAGVNHNGSEAFALELVAVAAASGADAVKFQTFQADSLVSPGTRTAEYQRLQTGDVDQHAMLRALEMSPEMHLRLAHRCEELGIEFMSTPFDAVAADFLVDLGVRRIKVPSGELTNDPFLEYLAGKKLPLIVSTGMASLAEVQHAVEVIARTRRQPAAPLSESVTLLHCTSNYPAALSDVNLRAMQTMANATGLPVGYSDHTLGILVPAAAVALGAVVIEKHFTLDRTLPGPDHRASLMPDELRDMVRQIREIECALGASCKEPTASELPVRDLVRRSVTAVRPLRRGDMLRTEDLALLRPGSGIPPRDLERVLGRICKRDLPAGTTLQWADVE